MTTRLLVQFYGMRRTNDPFISWVCGTLFQNLFYCGMTKDAEKKSCEYYLPFVITFWDFTLPVIRTYVHEFFLNPFMQKNPNPFRLFLLYLFPLQNLRNLVGRSAVVLLNQKDNTHPINFLFLNCCKIELGVAWLHLEITE